MIRDTKYLLRILVLYIPLPFYSALYDQKGSRWTLQVLGMDLYLVSSVLAAIGVQILIFNFWKKDTPNEKPC